MEGMEVQRKVLIFEEGVPVIPFEETLLLRKENEVLRSNSVDETLAILNQKKVDLLIVDDKINEISVEEFARKIREEINYKDLSILLLSSNALDTPPKGINAVIKKPLSSSEFNEYCKKLLSVESRKELRLLVYVQVQGFVRSNFFLCNSRNLSASGILIMTTKILKIGEGVQLMITLPREKEKVKAFARVAREAKEVSTQLNAYGLQFVEISEKDRERIRNFVNEQKNQNESF
jgi:CheY-like chemotaxis protein